MGPRDPTKIPQLMATEIEDVHSDSVMSASVTITLNKN